MMLSPEEENPGATAIAAGVSNHEVYASAHSSLTKFGGATGLEAQSPEDFERETLALLNSGPAAGVAAPRSASKAIPLRWHGEADPHADRAWLIRNIMPEKGKGLLSGQWGTAKTFSALDLSGAVMSGLPFAGHKVDRRGGVLFIAAEGGFEIPIRMRGLVEGKLRPAHAAQGLDLDRLPFTWVEECPRLLEAEALATLCATAEAAAARFRSAFDLPLVLIVIDTLAAAAGFDDENSAAETQKVLNLMQALSSHTGAFVLGVDHFGKAVETGTRGSSAKEAAADMVLAMLGDKDVSGTVSNVRMAVRKVRGARCGYEVPLSLEVVELGETDDGDPITSCFVAWQSADQAAHEAARGNRWPATLKALQRAVSNVLADKGVRLRPFGNEGPEVLAASGPDIRAEFIASYPTDGETEAQRSDAKRKAYKRSLKTATDKGLIASRQVNGVDRIWLPAAV
ncbi:ATP-binding protein [Methylobacterium radiotolerans]|uniref:AAA domain-containing protein n=1 Tax=Methylobacterium radiotolerans (strain ATCC 27329 / DSM 1819 / JCM 2831 / NBRC 15690 / NCIMB 10815 / 0-1) TaxID=426355 RepID=B1MAB1_METRJ|nr:AAA family ATPase [Methylobacterium radiotolerans]ACB28436.1 hypothetical protein Mrad2831_6524 [Methylobacterium radiotolerans JCM 2831]GEN01732.1 hypothetical protein MRA01_62710 [Methylobacterium radiotolerans]